MSRTLVPIEDCSLCCFRLVCNRFSDRFRVERLTVGSQGPGLVSGAIKPPLQIFRAARAELGRAVCRGRECESVYKSGDGVSLKKTIKSCHAHKSRDSAD